MPKLDIEGLVKMIRDTFGDSNSQTREAVIKAFWGKENLCVMTQIWAADHKIKYRGVDTEVAFATAVDLGYRMGKKLGIIR